MAPKETDQFLTSAPAFIEPEGTGLKAALDVARKYWAVHDRDLPLADYATAGCDPPSCPGLSRDTVAFLLGHGRVRIPEISAPSASLNLRRSPTR